ncbi:MAG: FAD-dependent oxidoreductase [Chlamydiales bacterium]|nr:FAD-dependent oxidoreductase [Chlamydiales bacterium]
MTKKRILILGGGFGGIYTAIQLEKLLKRSQDIEIALVNRENYFVYQPMLAEVVGGSVDILNTVSSIRQLLPSTKLFFRDIEDIDINNQIVTLSPQFSHTPYRLNYDHLILSLGNVTDFRGMPGLHEHALPFKNLADALTIRNQVIDAIEAASVEQDPVLKKQLLTFVVAGGGFSGTEVVAEVNDLVRSMIRHYPEINPSEVRVILIHSKDRLMDRELSPSLGIYAQNLLMKRGVEIFFNTCLIAASPQEAITDKKGSIKTKTIVSTVPSSPNPLIESLSLPKEKGKVKTDKTMLVESMKNVWAIGDCALIPQESGGFCPPTAQFAIREATKLAYNIVATINNKPTKNFSFKALGMLGALGHHSAVAELFGVFKFSGFFAWLMWRAIYWVKLPGFARKIKVGASWFLDALLPREAVQLKIQESQGIASLHFEKGEIIFNEGDIGDYLYIIVDGSVEVLKKTNGTVKQIATLSKGEYFGELALLNKKERSATIRCLTPTNVLALRKRDFSLLIANFQELRKNIEETLSIRQK